MQFDIAFEHDWGLACSLILLLNMVGVGMQFDIAFEHGYWLACSLILLLNMVGGWHAV